VANYSKQTLIRVGRLLNGNETSGHLARLAEWTGFGRKAIHNWTQPEDVAQFRVMPPAAKRVVVLLAYFGMVGLLNEQRLKDIQALEAFLDKEGQFQKITLRFSRILKTQVAVEEPSTSPVADREFPN
jgi:hypothetical protein